MRKIGFVVALLAMSACTSNPKVSFNYGIPTTDVDIMVVQAVSCDSADKIHVATSAGFTEQHTPAAYASFDLSKIDGFGTNTNVGLDLYPNGLLKGINATTEGKGGEIVQGVISVASSVAGAVAPLLSSPENVFCNTVNGGKATRDKTISVVYKGIYDGATGGTTPVTLNPTSGSQVAHSFLRSNSIIGPSLLATPTLRPLGTTAHPVTGLPVPNTPVQFPSSSSFSGAQLTLIQPGAVGFSITGRVIDRWGSLGSIGMLTSGVSTVADQGESYEVPIPKGKLFGKQDFIIQIAQSGALEKLSYGNESNFEAVANSASSFIDLFERSTTAERATEAKAEADLIYQTNRVALCQANIEECPK